MATVSNPSSDSPSSQPAGDAGTRRQALSVAAACLAIFCAYVPLTAVSVALPSIQADLGVTTSELTWVLDAFVLAMAAFILLSGTLGERYGHKKVLLAGLSLICLGAVLGLSSGASVELLWTAQTVLGLAAASLLASSLAVVSHAVPDPRRRAHAIAAWASSLALGLVVGPWLSTLVIDAADAHWVWLYFTVVPFALLGIALASLGVAETQRHAARALDAPGQITAVLAIALLVFAVIEGPNSGWGSTRVVTAFVLSALALAGFVLRESRTSSPMLDLRLFHSRQFTATTVVAMLVMFGLVGTLFLLSLFFGGVQHRTVGAVALRFLVVTGPIVVTGPLAARIAHRSHPRVPLIMGLVLGGAGMLSLIGLSTGSGLGELWWRLAAIGAGFGLVLASMTAIAVGSVPAPLMGVAGAAINTLRQTGGALGPAVLGAVVTGRVAATLPHEFAARRVPPETAVQAHTLLSRGGLRALGELPPGPQSRAVLTAAGHAFTSGIHVAVALSGGALLAAALLALVVLRPTRRTASTKVATNLPAQGGEARTHTADRDTERPLST
ncbi:drug:proton antiporter [Streptomyces sp. Act143]|uniref:MFS transporter n=1 Tax=Streptomyces sp. Act143 TaxID=2200760 RepID=UPI000D6745E4|nr:MFS transporter [Streptomyces sp. Act143]PWI19365.1 drug:proton antiporter [Streptomyces sp. Act143]